jgi:hypothetical protein
MRVREGAVWIALLCGVALGATPEVQITLALGTAAEAEKLEELQGLLKQYDLGDWVWTRRVVIEGGAIPHSYPVLTLNTKDTGLRLLDAGLHDSVRLRSFHPGSEAPGSHSDACCPVIMPTPAIPTGTKVLTRPTGRVGVILGGPDPYHVRFPEGDEADFPRSALTNYRHALAEIPLAVDPISLRPHVQYRCIVGSTAYGLATESSDLDRRVSTSLQPTSIGPLPASRSSSKPHTKRPTGKSQSSCASPFKANPNVLECLYSPLIEHATPLAQELLAMRDIFLSRHVHRTYNAYVLSQFKKLEQDLRSHGQIRWKHVMHLIRLLLSGITVLREGFVPLRVGEHRDRLLAIGHGQISWEEVETWRLDLHRRLDDALAVTRLPEHPEYARADQFLIRARRLAQ